MPKELIKKYIPKPEQLKNIRGLGWLEKHLFDPALWHIHRRPLGKAMFIGLFWAWVPMPFQMLPAAIMAILLRANAPVALALVWISNPITYAPIFYVGYFVGAHILGLPLMPASEFSFSLEWLGSTLEHIWQPLYLGCLLMGVLTGTLAWFAMNFAWRQSVRKRWRERRQLKTGNSPGL